MPLRMRVTGSQAAGLGEYARATFGVNGGRIGRALDNDWVLPDPDRYVSTHHAEVHYRSGEWVLRDLSTNGTFVNDRVTPIGHGNSHVLRHGDRLQMGNFRMQVEISGGTDFPPDEAEVDHGESLDVPLDEVLGLAPPPKPAAGRAPAPATPPGRGGPGREELELLPGIAALCRGAGIDPATLPPGSRAMVLQQAGQMLRELVLGLTELHRSRADFARDFGVAPLARDADGTSPLARMASVEDMLVRWLAQSSATARPVDELRDLIAAARAHERAVGLGLRAGLGALLARLEPDAFEASGPRNALTAEREREQAWQRFREAFRAAAQAKDSGLPAGFADEFARAYRSVADGTGEADGTLPPTRR